MDSRIGNIFKDLPTDSSSEIFEVLHNSNGVTIERILSTGHVTPTDEWYDQDWDEWVILEQGKGTLEFEDGKQITLEKGDYLFIPKGKKHRVVFTADKTIWLTVNLRNG
jgi:cupin 2 domain-containing protein